MIYTSKIRLAWTFSIVILCSSCNGWNKIENTTSSSISRSKQSEVPMNQSRIREYVTAFVNNRDFDGFVLVKSKDQTIISESISLMDELSIKSKFMIGSITKTFTAEAIQNLIRQNKLKEDTRISDIFSASKKHNDITIRHILMHASGIPDYYNIEEFGMIRNNDMPLEVFYSWISKYPLDFKPGTSNNYSNSGYNVAALGIETITEEKYHEYLTNSILSPLKMNDTGSISSDNIENIVAGYAPGNLPALIRSPHEINNDWLIGSGSMFSTAEDLLKWGNEIKHRLKSGDDWKPYGWGIRQRETQIYLEQNGRIPGYSASIQIYPETDFIIILLSRIESDAVGVMANGIADILHDVKVEIPQRRTIKEVNLNDLSQYSGVYEITPSFFITVSIDDNGLGIATGRGSNLSYSALDPLGNDKFFFRVGYTEVRFEQNNEGSVTGLFWGDSGPFKKL